MIQLYWCKSVFTLHIPPCKNIPSTLRSSDNIVHRIVMHLIGLVIFHVILPVLVTSFGFVFSQIAVKLV